MRAIWKGSISFGLVNIPVSLYAAAKNEELKFRLLRASDLSPVNYKRVAEADGREVPWDQIVKGYEYAKGKFVVLKDEDFKRVDVEATQTVDIVDFVELREINPIFFFRPYYLEPQRGGAGAYALLREVLTKTGKIGIAKVVIKTRQHLAALKPNSTALLLELMHFGEELIDSSDLKIPEAKTAGKRELEMASALVAQMTEKWDPHRYHDEYTSALMRLIDRKIGSEGRTLPVEPRRRRQPSNVIDLAAVLQKSLDQTGRRQRSRGATKHAGKKVA